MQTEKIMAFVRQNLFAFILGFGVLGMFLFFNLSGRECFNCEKNQTFKPDQRNRSSGIRFHK